MVTSMAFSAFVMVLSRGNFGCLSTLPKMPFMFKVSIFGFLLPLTCTTSDSSEVLGWTWCVPLPCCTTGAASGVSSGWSWPGGAGGSDGGATSAVVGGCVCWAGLQGLCPASSATDTVGIPMVGSPTGCASVPSSVGGPWEGLSLSLHILQFFLLLILVVSIKNVTHQWLHH